jgi:hypothetical protein
LLRRAVDDLEVLAASIIRTMIILMMAAASTSERFVKFYQTSRRNKPEDSHLKKRTDFIVV